MGSRISAVICTLNRADYLRKALKSLVDQTLPKDQYEILVVDNGSTDDTKRVVLNEYRHIPNIRYTMEPDLGLNRARNTGWKQACGDYVAYLDDDAIACTQWLERILQAFETIQPTLGCVGGKIDPIWEGSQPDWLSHKLVGFLAVLDLSPAPFVSTKKQVLAGVNMAISRQVLEEVGGFHPDLDRRGDNLLSNGDVLLQLKVLRRGYPCYYHPDILVRHHIPAARLSKEWFIRRMYWEGVSIAYMNEHLDPPSMVRRLWNLTYAACRIGFSVRNYVNPRFFTSDAERFAWKCFNQVQLGYMAGLIGKAG